MWKLSQRPCVDFGEKLPYIFRIRYGRVIFYLDEKGNLKNPDMESCMDAVHKGEVVLLDFYIGV